MRSRAAGFILLGLASGCTCGEPPRDLVLLVVDALRADRFGLDHRPTPSFARLEAQGVVYERAFAHGVDTVHALPPLLGGLERDAAGPRWLGGRFPDHRRGFFAGNGLVGPPLTDGFDDLVEVEYTYGEPRVDGEDLVARFEAWLSAHPEPVLAVLHAMDVHAPYASTCGEGPALALNGPLPETATPEALDLTRRRYDDGVACFDPLLGRVMAALEARPREVLLVVTADHGESLGERGLLGHGTRVVPETARVPLATWTPGGEPGRSDEPVGHEIVAPLLEGHPPPPRAEIRIQPGAVVRWPLLLTREATFDLESGDASGPRDLSVDFSHFPAYRPPEGGAGRREALGYGG